MPWNRLIVPLTVVTALVISCPALAAPLKEDEGAPAAGTEDAPAAAKVAVHVLPFRSIGEDPVGEPDDDARPASNWIGRAIAEALVSDLSIDARLRLTGGAEPAADADAAAAAGEKAGSAFVVFGSYQRVDGLVRITGQILDVEKNEVAAGVKATGPLRDLFALQDSLAHQVQRRILRDEPDAPAVAHEDEPDNSPELRPGDNEAVADVESDRDRPAREVAVLEADDAVELGVRAAPWRRLATWKVDRGGSVVGGGAFRYYYQSDYATWYTPGVYIGSYGRRYSPYRYRDYGCPPYRDIGPGYHHYHRHYDFRPTPIRVRVTNSPSGWSSYPHDRTPARGTIPGGVRMTQRPPRR